MTMALDDIEKIIPTTAPESSHPMPDVVLPELTEVNGPLCRIHSATMPQATPGAPVFVMVHGIGMSHRYFDRLQGELIHYGNTHVLDLPGFGGTPKPGRQLDVVDYAAAIGRAMDSANIRSSVMIGHSMGAQFVTELALQRPDLVSELVLIGPVTDPARRSAIWHGLALGLDSLRERPRTNMMVFTDYVRCGLRWYFTELPVMLRYRLHERLPLVSQPVLVIRGGNDPVSRHPWCVRLVGTGQDARLVEIPGQPHVAHRGGVQEVATAILTLLGQKYRLPFTPGSQPQTVRAGTQTMLTRLRAALSVGNRVARRLDAPDFHSITLGDRQCRAYRVMHRAPEPDAGCRPTPNARVFVLIHGIGMSHRYFTRLAAVLADHGEVYLIDLPGHGSTGTPVQKISNSIQADLVGALLDQIGVLSCTVVGHSMGVQSATELAITRPDLVMDLVLIGAAVDAQRRTVIQQALRLGANSALEKPLLNAVQFLDVLRCGSRWYLAELDVAMSYRLEERLSLIKQKVLVMRGTRDLVAGRRWSRTLAETAQNGTLVEIPGKPHSVHHSAPALVATGIIEFAKTGTTGPQAPNDEGGPAARHL